MRLPRAFEESVHIARRNVVGAAEGYHKVGIVLTHAALSGKHFARWRIYRGGLWQIFHHLVHTVAQLFSLLQWLHFWLCCCRSLHRLVYSCQSRRLAVEKDVSAALFLQVCFCCYDSGADVGENRLWLSCAAEEDAVAEGVGARRKNVVGRCHNVLLLYCLKIVYGRLASQHHGVSRYCFAECHDGLIVIQISFHRLNLGQLVKQRQQTVFVFSVGRFCPSACNQLVQLTLDVFVKQTGHVV